MTDRERSSEFTADGDFGERHGSIVGQPPAQPFFIGCGACLDLAVFTVAGCHNSSSSRREKREISSRSQETDREQKQKTIDQTLESSIAADRQDRQFATASRR